MDEKLKAYIRFEGKVWFVDLTKPGAFKVEIIESDGSRRPAKVKDGSFLDAMERGEVITSPKQKPIEEKEDLSETSAKTQQGITLEEFMKTSSDLTKEGEAVQILGYPKPRKLQKVLKKSPPKKKNPS
jgi:hypothetical protein